MRVRAARGFHDLRARVVRERGDEFEVSAARYREIESKLPGYLEKVAEEAEEAPRAKRRRAANKSKATEDK